MTSQTFLQQMAILFAMPWGNRPTDTAQREILLELYRPALSDLADGQLVVAVKRAVQQAQWFPTPVELRALAGAPTDPETMARERRQAEPDYLALAAGDDLYLLPQKATKTPGEYRAEHARLKAELKEKWRAMDEERKANPRPGPGYEAMRRQDRDRRAKLAAYPERGTAQELLLDVAAGMRAGREEWIRRRVALEQP
jgi:hypothetical protein